MLVADASSSMGGEKIIHAKLAAKTFVDQMDTNIVQAGVVVFASTAEQTQSLTNNKETLKIAIESINLRTGTNLAAGLAVATESLISDQEATQRVMIVLTDGRSNTGASPQSAAVSARSQGIRIITIGLGENADQEVLRSIASSEADFYFAPTSSDLLTIYAYLVQDVKKCTHIALP